MLSVWEQDVLLKYDYIVVGSGVIGLSAAIALRELDGNATIAILEKSIFPTGNSSRNIGRICYGSATEALRQKEQGTIDAMLSLIEKRLRGVEWLQRHLGNENIGYEEYGGYELLFEGDVNYADRIEESNAIVEPVLEPQYFSLHRGLVPAFGFSPHYVKAVVQAPHEGQVHVGKLMNSLYAYARQCGIVVLTGTEVVALEHRGDTHSVMVRQHLSPHPIEFRGHHVTVCSRSLASTLLLDAQEAARKSLYCTTNRLSGIHFRGFFYTTDGNYCFRDIGDRIIVSAKFHVSAEAGNGVSVQELARENIRVLLHDVVMPDKEVSIDSEWIGIDGFGGSALPIVRQMSSGIAIGVRNRGVELPLGIVVGREIAEAVIGRKAISTQNSDWWKLL